MQNGRERFRVFGMGILLAVSMVVLLGRQGGSTSLAMKGEVPADHWMRGQYYLGETVSEILDMTEDPDFDLDRFLSHTVFAGMTRADLLTLQEEGFLSLETYLAQMPQVLMGETKPVLTVKNYSAKVGTSLAFHIQSYQLSGEYGVCMENGAPVVTGTVYPLLGTSGSDGLNYSAAVEQILGVSRQQQSL